MSMPRTSASPPQRLVLALMRFRADLGSGVRQVMRKPGPNLLIVGILALGLGAAGAMVGVLRPLLLQPLPYLEPDRLTYVWETDLANNEPYGGASYLDWQDWRARSKTYAALSAYQRSSFSARAEGAEPERARGLDVDHGLASVLGLVPLHGRLFSAEDDRAGAAPVAMLGYAYWLRRYGGDAAVVGRTIELDGKPHAVIGILPPANGWALKADVWRPLVPSMQRFQAERGVHSLVVVGRLAPGATRQAAGVEMAAIAGALEREYPDTNKGRSTTVVGMHAYFVRDLARPLWLLAATVGLLLLMTCSNAAGLLLARTGAREAELALRSSLGAQRRRLAAQVASETLILGLLGGALGVALCVGTLELLTVLNPVPALDVDSWRVDGAVLVFMFVLSVFTAVAASVGPGLVASRASPMRALGRVGRGVLSGGQGRHARHGLVALQVALSLCMLLATSVLVRGYLALSGVELGLRADSVATIAIKVPGSKYPTPAQTEYPKWPQVVELNRRLLESVAAVPGVRDAALSMQPPLAEGWTTRVEVEGQAQRAAGAPDEWQMRPVSPGYFALLGVPLRSGRELLESDRAGAPDVVVINESAARQYFPGVDPVGKRISFWGRQREIVGVVGNVRSDGVAQEPQPAIHAALAQLPFADLTLVARVEGDAGAAIPALQRAIWAVEPDAVPFDAEPLAVVADRLLATQRFTLGVALMLALCALVLTLAGIAGIVAHEVALRRNEIGVRVALGARARSVLVLLMRRSLALVAGGAACGLVLYVAVAPLLQGSLHMVSARDPVAIALASGLLALVAALASMVPASAALRIAPSDALRND